jgi:hypothetical protein
MTFDRQRPRHVLPAQRWFRPVHGKKSRLELTPVSIVVFPTHKHRPLGISIWQG